MERVSASELERKLENEFGEDVVDKFGHYGDNPRTSGEYIDIDVPKLEKGEREKLETTLPPNWSISWEYNETLRLKN